MCLLVACVFDHAQVQLHGLPACFALLHLYNTFLCDGLHWKGLLALSYCPVGGVVGCFMQLVGFLVDGFLC